MYRKVEMLQVQDIDEEFELKTGCFRKKSEDFNRERDKNLLKISITGMPDRFDNHRLGGSSYRVKRPAVSKRASIK